jgi:membrane-bound serine protease (ClpP class)
MLGVAPLTVPAADLTVGGGVAKERVKVVVIPVRDEIASPTLFILRRGLKEAEREKAELVVLDIKTPGGALDTTFEIMEALTKFSGRTIAYVNPEAMSAGAFISATTGEIWFAPTGVIGAAAPVQAGGQDVDATMKLKIVSYLKARIRAMSEGKGFRGEVISAMIDSDYELKIDDKVIKGKGELLSLTASEASKVYGSPEQPLLAAGIARDIDELLTKKFGAGGFEIKRLEVTWSEQFAVFLHAISPILLGLGLLALYIEFKTPGFGVFGVSGIVLLAVVFLSNYVAGLSGHEPILIFALGMILLVLEILLFPGVMLMALAGVVLMLGSLLWSMADLWPNEPISVAWSADAFVTPVLNLGMGLAIAVVLALLLARFIPKGWVWDRMVVQTASGGEAQISGLAPELGAHVGSLVGVRGVAVTALRPGGQVEVAGRRYEARVDVGSIDAGSEIVVRGRMDFALIVEAAT